MNIDYKKVAYLKSTKLYFRTQRDELKLIILGITIIQGITV